MFLGGRPKNVVFPVNWPDLQLQNTVQVREAEENIGVGVGFSFPSSLPPWSP